MEASPTTGSRISSFVFTEKSFSSGSSASESSAPPSALDAPALDNALRIPSPANYPVYKDLLSTGTALHPTVAGETDDNPFLYRPPSLPLTPTAYSFPSSTLTADHFSQPEPTPPPASDSLPRQSTPPQATSDSPALLAGNSFISSEIFELYESLPPLSRVSNRTKVGEVDLREKQDPENESEDDQKSTELDERPATGSSVVVYSLGDGEQRFERRIRELEERATRAEQGFRELEVERDKRGDGIEEMLDGLGINVVRSLPLRPNERAANSKSRRRRPNPPSFSPLPSPAFPNARIAVVSCRRRSSRGMRGGRSTGRACRL